MPKFERRWTKVKILSVEERTAIATVRERFILEVLKPRFLPDVRTTSFNYPVDIRGKRRGKKYSFVIRYRAVAAIERQHHQFAFDGFKREQPRATVRWCRGDSRIR